MVMRPAIKSALLFFILLILAGCGQKGAKLQKSVVPPDKTLFETGDEYLRKSQYIKARLAFQTLINTYPDSDLTADAYLAIGDSFYDEGGTENLLQAEDQYKNFIIFFPTSPKAADAQMKIISANMRMMRSPDRDPTYSVKAEAAIKKFLEMFPDNDYTPIARQFLKEVQENLAQGDLGVALFYEQRGNYVGAKSRLKEIAEKYKDFSAMDQTLFKLAESLEKTENPDEAAIYYGEIAKGFPFSSFHAQAKERLEKLGKPLPSVDPQLAATNERNLKPHEPFSPLKPFVNFIEALGFMGPEDRYEMAKKSVDAQRDAALQAGKQTEAAGGDVQIEALLEQNATGQTRESAVVGSRANAPRPTTDKNGDGKKNSEKDTKKTNEKKPS
jgi:outer membrane protein assembly factor BamD